MRLIGRGWSPLCFFDKTELLQGKISLTKVQSKLDTHILRYKENAVRFNWSRSIWGEEGISFHVSDDRFKTAFKDLLYALVGKGITPILALTQHDGPPAFGGPWLERYNPNWRDDFNKVKAIHQQFGLSTDDRYIFGSIQAFAPWIKWAWDDLMAHVGLMRSIAPVGTVAQLTNERPANWELSPFKKVDVVAMSIVFPSVAKAFGIEAPATTDFSIGNLSKVVTPTDSDIRGVAVGAYLNMYSTFRMLWGQDKTIQDFVEQSGFTDPGAWAYACHPYPHKAWQTNIRYDTEWMSQFRTSTGLPVNAICEIGVPDELPSRGDPNNTVDVYKVYANNAWRPASRLEVLRDAIFYAMDIIQNNTGRPPKVLIGWEAPGGRFGLKATSSISRSAYLRQVASWELTNKKEWDLGFENLYIREDLWDLWSDQVIPEFWKRDIQSSEAYLL